MIGFYKIIEFKSSKDSAGAETQALVMSEMDENIRAIVYLPPYLRKTQSNISIGSVVLAVVDDVSGIGAALFGKDSADFQYFFDADILMKQKLNVMQDITGYQNITITNNITANLGNITASVGDVLAGITTLKTHIHQVTTIPTNDCALIVGSPETGNPAELTETFTIIPTTAV